MTSYAQLLGHARICTIEALSILPPPLRQALDSGGL